MKKNEGLFDRFARIVLALILAFAAYTIMTGVWQAIVYVLAAILAITAGTGFCALYTLFGINTNK
ncbi:MAG: DUF2892 domain-containing protein [Patescibacteria group bacterium]